MRSWISLTLAGALAGAATALVGCQSKSEPTASNGEPKAAVQVERASRAYRTKPVQDGHAIAVRVQMATRRAPPSWPIPAMVQSQCGGADHVTDEAISAASDGGANGAVVWLDDIHEGRPLVPATATQDEKRCVFAPHVLALPAAGTLTLSNSDPSNHAVRFDFEGQPDLGFMKTLPAGASIGVPIQEDWAGRVVRLTCPIHLWMFGYGLFFEHPYFAVTRDGSARIEGIPPGTYHLSVWHEGTTSTYDSKVKLSTPQTARVEVVIGSVDVNLQFAIADDGMISRQ